MTFWLVVGTIYLALLGVGLAFGHHLAVRGRGGGWGRDADAPAPVAPIGPTHALRVPPLGSDFDRKLLPGVLYDEPLAEAV